MGAKTLSTKVIVMQLVNEVMTMISEDWHVGETMSTQTGTLLASSHADSGFRRGYDTL